MNKKPRYNEANSKVGARKRAAKILLDQGHKPWEQHELNAGWVLYLEERGWKTISATLCRSERSCVTMFEHKVIAEPSKYPVQLNFPRTAKFWNEREHATIKRCIKHGWTAAAIAKILGRTETAVEQHVNKRQAAARPTLT